MSLCDPWVGELSVLLVNVGALRVAELRRASVHTAVPAVVVVLEVVGAIDCHRQLGVGQDKILTFVEARFVLLSHFPHLSVEHDANQISVLGMLF